MSGIFRRIGLLVIALVIAAVVAGTSVVSAANPTATPGAAGDTRRAGEGPGLVGAPGLAILGGLALGLGTVVLTLAYVRATDHGRRES
jgi:hypothetical protein